jgi:hypothetical protein
MGTTVIAGMVAATVIAIFLIPTLFVLVERWSGGEKKHPRGGAAALPGTPGNAPATAGPEQ